MTDTRPWWLWPNLLGLDAPAVAVAWQQFLAAAAGVRVPAAAVGVLGLVVWAVYLGDRWLDARRGVRTADRHRFAARHPRVTGVAAAVVFAAASVLATRLPPRYLAVGAATAAVLAGYLAAVHAGLDRLLPGAKEAAVGLVFGSGVAVPLIAAAGPGAADWVPDVAAFAGLCWLNCALISRWEDGPPAAPPGWTVAVAAGLALAAALAAGPPILLPVLVSLGLLAALHLAPARLPIRGRRVLADLVLLTPVVFGAVP